MDSIAQAITAVRKANIKVQRRDNHAESAEHAAHEQVVSIETHGDSHSDLTFISYDDLKKLSFPAKLHAILSHWDIEDIVSWMPHGRAWRIHDPEGFQRLIMPRFFHKCKYTSFLRQLNGWGFRRMRCMTPDWNAFHHDYFIRGDLHKCRLMVRPSTSVTSSVQNQHFCDPDFYSMEFIPELKQKFRFDKPEAAVNLTDQALSKKRTNDDTRKNAAVAVKKRRPESEAATFKVPVSEVVNGHVGRSLTTMHDLNPVLGTNMATIVHPYRLLSNEPPSRMVGPLAVNLEAIYGSINRAPTVQQYRQSTQLLPYLHLSCSAASPPAAVTSHLSLIAPQLMLSNSDLTALHLGSGLAAVQTPLYERLNLFPSSVALEMESIALERFREEARVNAAIRLGVHNGLKMRQPFKHPYPVSDGCSYGVQDVAAVDPLSLLASIQRSSLDRGNG